MKESSPVVTPNGRPRSELTKAQRAEICAAHAAGVSNKELAVLHKVHRNTISKTLQRFKTVGSLESAPRPGRPPLFSPAQKRYLNQVVKRDPGIKWRDLRNDAPKKACVTTIRAALEPEVKRKRQQLQQEALDSAKETAAARASPPSVVACAESSAQECD